LFSLYNLYWYYDASVRGSVEIERPGLVFDDDKFNAETSFSTLAFVNSANQKLVLNTLYFSIRNAIDTSFWALFGVGNGKEIRFKSNLKNFLTEDFGFIIYGIFHVSGIVMLVNMLTAMMTKSYDRIRVS
jgi:hypothetical protein